MTGEPDYCLWSRKLMDVSTICHCFNWVEAELMPLRGSVTVIYFFFCYSIANNRAYLCCVVEKLLVNDKTTASCQRHISLKHYKDVTNNNVLTNFEKLFG